MKSYTQHFGTVATAQTEAIPGREAEMVPNAAGGYAFPVDDWTRLDRFLILGGEGGTYYVTEHKLTVENASAVLRCIKADGPRTVARIQEISLAGRSPKTDPAIFALAMAAKKGDAPTRKAALAAVSDVCRIGTHLFAFAEALQAFGGWGRGTRQAVAGWYEREDLAYQLIKYRQRNGWTHRDLLRLSHPKPGEHGDLYAWATKEKPTEHALIAAFTELQTATPKRASELIAEHRLPREAVPTDLLNDKTVWAALLEGMPMTAMLRSLGKMSAVGLIAPLGDAGATIAARLRDPGRLKKARIHPMQVLAALRIYALGHGEKGSLTWGPERRIVAALDEAFYASFGAVEPTGKRFILACDVSGSMKSPVSGLPMGAYEVAASLAFVVQKTEPNVVVLAFADREPWVVDFTPHQRVDDAIRHLAQYSGGTDCSIPLRWATRHKVNADLVAIFTDEETWAGPMHVVQSLIQYRANVNPAAKLVADNFVATGTSVVEGPPDGGVLRVVGFDTNVPNLIADFAAPRLGDLKEGGGEFQPTTSNEV